MFARVFLDGLDLSFYCCESFIEIATIANEITRVIADLIILYNILELSILKFVIISFEIMLLRVTSILSMFAPTSN